MPSSYWPTLTTKRPKPQNQDNKYQNQDETKTLKLDIAMRHLETRHSLETPHHCLYVPHLD